MLGDLLPSADIQAPENKFIVCMQAQSSLSPRMKIDLALIFSRFDEKIKAEIIQDPETGNSLQVPYEAVVNWHQRSRSQSTG